MATLSSYLTDLQTILHDQNNNFWTQQQLTNNINEARERVARDTGCLRVLQGAGVGVPLSTPIAAYNPYGGGQLGSMRSPASQYGSYAPQQTQQSFANQFYPSQQQPQQQAHRL